LFLENNILELYLQLIFQVKVWHLVRKGDHVNESVPFTGYMTHFLFFAVLDGRSRTEQNSQLDMRAAAGAPRPIDPTPPRPAPPDCFELIF
jgi:hypothetical protein